MHTITTEEVLTKTAVQSAPTDLEAFRVVYKMELKSTAYDGKYSGCIYHIIKHYITLS
jgi:hypothetical protein